MEIFQNRQQHEVVAKTSREETTSSSKRGIMGQMLETPGGLAMKKTAEKRASAEGQTRLVVFAGREAQTKEPNHADFSATIRKSAVSQAQNSAKAIWARVSNAFPRQSFDE